MKTVCPPYCRTVKGNAPSQTYEAGKHFGPVLFIMALRAFGLSLAQKNSHMQIKAGKCAVENVHCIAEKCIELCIDHCV